MKKHLSPIFFLLIGLIFTSCSATDVYDSYDKVDETAMHMDEVSNQSMDNDTSSEMADDGEIYYGLSESADRKIERTYYYWTNTTDFDADKQKLDDLISKYKGYIESEAMNKDKAYDSNAERKTSNFTIKIPADQSDKFRAEFEQLGEISSSNNYISDLTQSYIDINIRLDSKKTELAKLNELIEKTDNIEDVMAIQARILDVQAEIDQIETNKREIDQRVAYDTYEIYLEEVFSYNEIANRNPDFGQRIGNAFTDSIQIFINFIEDLLVAVVTIWPLILLAALIVFFITRRRKKKNIKTKTYEADEPSGDDF